MSNLSRTIRRNKVRLQIVEYNKMADKKGRDRAVKPSRLMSHIWKTEQLGKPVSKAVSTK